MSGFDIRLERIVNATPHVTVTFEPRGERTLLTMLDTGYPSDEQRAANESGWPGFLDAYERTLGS
jgi:Activator of Hsp90 ATPase homolog 1-like protein